MARLLFVVFALVPVCAGAQDRRWEIEAYGGLLVAQPSSAGTESLPPAGPPIATSTPTFPARATSSWFFGDGASMLNGVLDEFGRSAAIAPLDTAFGPMRSARVGLLGARVRRRLTRATSLEVGVDALAGSSSEAAELSDAVGQAAATFVTAFNDLFASGPFARTSVTAQPSAAEGKPRETAVTAAFNHDVFHLGALQPYVTLGGGVVFASGPMPSASLAGRYATAILGDVPIDETDRVAVRVRRSTTFAVVIGGGVRRDFSAWSLRADARLLAGPDTTRVRIDAAPSMVRGTPAGFIESFTNPAIQFSNDPAIGRVSSLSGAALQDVEVFKGGVIARTMVTFGVSRRF